MSLPDRTLVDLLRRQADARGDRPLFTFVEGARSHSMTYGELERRARAIAASLVAAGAANKRALLLYAPDLEYVCGFLGCLFAGVTAVPAYPPDPARLERSLPRLRAIVADADCAVVLTTAEIQSLAEFMLPQAPELAGLRWIATDSIEASTAESWRPPSIRTDTVAFIQYTSGSTGDPKGVVLTHGHLVHNLSLIMSAFELDERSVGFSWLPPYHDMGLIGGILGPIACGGHSALMSPIAFLQRPMSWLEGISRFRATISGGPNFAYELCLRRVSVEDLDALDLSSWSLAFCGAEQIRAETLDHFAAVFGQCGFRREFFYPCYGLAEGTLIVSGGKRDAAPVVREVDALALEDSRVVPSDGGRRKSLVGCGKSLANQRIRVVNRQTLARCEDLQVGEIWVAGPSIARGYWNKAEATRRAFGAVLPSEPDVTFLRTGDLGYLDDGELFVTGRVKDVIIVRGRNLYPQDLEKTAEEAHPSLRRGCSAAFALEIDGNEEMVVAVELERRHHQRRRLASTPPDAERRRTDRRSDRPTQPGDMGAPLPSPSTPEDVCEAVRHAIAREHDVRPHLVILVRAGSLPKTSSGKIQRSETRNLALAGKLDLLGQSESPVHSVRRPAVHTDEPPPSTDDLAASPRESRAAKLGAFLRSLIASGLGVTSDKVPLDAPLTALGLDSLTSVEIAHAVERQLGAVLPASAFLREHTLADLARMLADDIGTTPPPPMPPSDVQPTEKVLSPGQEALWFLQNLEPESSAYNVACAFTMTASAKWESVRDAITVVARRHEILYTLYESDESGRPRAEFQSEAAIQIDEVDAVDWTLDELQRRVDESANAPFDLAGGPLLRIHRYVRDDGSVLLLSSHHIALDFWSMTQLLGEIRRQLEALLQGSIEDGPAAIPYRTFIDWQRRETRARGNELWRHWQEVLTPPMPRLDLPTDRPRPRHQSFRGATHRFEIGADLTERVRSFARQHGTTPFVVLLSVYHLLFHQRADADDVLVGIPAAGRTRAELSRIVGLLINVVLVRTKALPGQTFIDFIYQVRRGVLDALDHQDMPFSDLVARMQPTRDPARSPLIDVLFAFEQAQAGEDGSLAQLALGVPGARASWPGGHADAFPVARDGAPFDLTLYLAGTGEGLAGWLTYCADLWGPESAAKLAEAYVHTLEAVLDTPTQALSELDFVPANDRALVARFNATGTSYSRSACIHDLVEQQVKRSPDALAVRADDGTLTYRELDDWAESIARVLWERGATRDRPVAVCLPRSTSVLAAHLGVLKAGAAFLSLDPHHPPERLKFMLEDSGADLVLTASGLHASLFAAVGVGAIDVAEARSRTVFAPQPVRRIHSEQLAYVIYTSGSTGVPKGVAVPHRTVINLLEAMRREPGMRSDDVLAAVTTTSFDISVLELFLPLICGARIELLSADEILDGRLLQRCLEERGVTMMQATPGLWHMLDKVGGPPRGTRVLSGGEALPRALADSLLSRGCAVYNGYGPTETTIYSTMETVPNDEAAVFIGHPVANTQIHVVDRAGSMAPLGTKGELFIGGQGLARGYLNRAGLTAERFIPDPFSARPGARMYRTGDLGRWRGDGRVELFGRADSQIKVRGHRVELGEIEAILSQHLAIAEAAVIPHPGADGVAQLIGYLTVSAQRPPGPAELERYLGQRLPAYMVPARFEVVDAMPRTPNGKVDRNALAARTAELPVMAPRAAPSDLELQVCHIFETVLGKSGITSDHDFFAAGGHSLMATQVAARIGSEMGIDVPLRTLFDARTPKLLAAALEALRQSQSARPSGPLLRPIPRARRRLLSEIDKSSTPSDERAARDKPGRGR